MRWKPSARARAFSSTFEQERFTKELAAEIEHEFTPVVKGRRKGRAQLAVQPEEIRPRREEIVTGNLALPAFLLNDRSADRPIPVQSDSFPDAQMKLLAQLPFVLALLLAAGLFYSGSVIGGIMLLAYAFATAVLEKN